MIPNGKHLVDVHDGIGRDFVASMADHLENALSWRVDVKPFIPVLRYVCADGVQRILVMEDLPLPESLTRRQDAPQCFADQARTNALLALRNAPSTTEELEEARRQLRNFAMVCAEGMRCEEAEEVVVRAPTPWSPVSIRCVEDPSRMMRHDDVRAMAPRLDDVRAMAPRLYEIGTSGDSSFAETSLALYTSPARSGRVDVIAAMRAMTELVAWHASGKDAGPRREDRP